MARVLLLNGPNLDLLGAREPDIYGSATLQDIETKLKTQCHALGHDLIAAQSNAEHELIAKIHAVKRDGIGFVIINPGAFTHTSIALRDAFLSVGVPFIESSLEQCVRARSFPTSLLFVRHRGRLHIWIGPDRLRACAPSRVARLSRT